VIAGPADPGAEAQPGLASIAGDATAIELAERLLGAMHEGVLICDSDGRVVYSNERAAEIAGIPRAAAAQPSAADARFEPILPDGRPLPHDECPSAVALRTGRRMAATLGVPKPSGTTWFLASSQPLHRPGEERPYAVITVLSDISEHVEAERALAAARDAALRASAVKSEFLATVSHEIRTPLTGVIGSLDLMLDSDLPAELAQLAAIAHTAAIDLSSIIDDVLSAAEHGAAAPGVDAPPRALSGLRVLIAEDNLVNQQVLVRQAQRLGMDADAVENGEQVLGALERGHYDAVLMDCQMPVMDGFAATRAIRQRELAGSTRMPIVAVTANAMREDVERSRDAGMDDFVAKPVTLTALANAIERALGASRGAPVAPAPAGGVDMAALAALREDVGGAGALARIVRLFLEQLDPQAEQIAAAARGADRESLARSAHRMRSSAATLGATAMADLLSALEAAARDGDAAACDRLAAAFAAQVVATRARFEELLGDLDAGGSAD
jgi:CheY-like chemotaxis protein/HPt (histidine-containing phosphotransfer) domain-containing protein